MSILISTDTFFSRRTQVFENLSRTLFAPSVQMQEVPRDQDMSEDEDEQDPDERFGRKIPIYYYSRIHDIPLTSNI
jgi:histone deacetylase 1/2